MAVKQLAKFVYISISFGCFGMQNFTFFIRKDIECHKSPQMRSPELIFGARFTARRAESEFDSFEAFSRRLVFSWRVVAFGLFVAILGRQDFLRK